MRTPPEQAGYDRRRWLTTSAAILLLGPGRLAAQEPQEGLTSDLDPYEGISIERIRERANLAGLPGLEIREAKRYLALGTAPDDFLEGALKLCEGLADDFLQHFKSRDFSVEDPTARMMMVSLASHEQFGQFLGTELPADVTGIYEVGPNYLVLYDGRSGSPSGAQAERANSITLFHEATHQLTFNTGMLDPGAEIPLSILEGLAMYGEVRRPDGRTRIGAVNRERFGVIVSELRRGSNLFPLNDLLGNDDLFDREETVQLAYAQSWLLVYALMREKQTMERFRAYLEALRTPQPPRDRLELVKEALGDPAQIEGHLRNVLVRLQRGR